MKKLLSIVCLLAGSALLTMTVLTTTARAQLPLISTTQEVFQQMWNTASYAQYGTMTKALLGTQYDVKASGVTTYLTSGVWNGDYTQLKAGVIPGTGGSISMIVATYRANLAVTTNPTVTITPECSFDSLIWVPVPGYTASTLTPALTNSVTPVCAKWSIAVKDFRLLRAKVTVNADSVKFAAFYDWLAPWFITK